MAEYSRPMPGTTIGDAGPYQAPDWWDVWGAMSRSGFWLGDAVNYNLGVFYQMLNQLEPSINGTNIRVQTGGSLVDGLYHYCDSLVTVPIPASGAGTSRIDVIVVRKNYQQAVTYTPSGAAPTVGPRRARITVIRGVEAAGPVAPALTQDLGRTTYWDIPIASIQVSDAGVLSNLTDLREYVDAEEKQFFVPALVGVNITDSTDIILTYSNPPSDHAIILPTNKDCIANGTFIVPEDYISGLSVSAITVTGGGDVYAKIDLQYSACGQSYLTHVDYGTIAVITTDANHTECIADMSPTAESVGDIMIAQLYRNGSDPLDTYGGSLITLGFKVTYLGWKK